MILNYQSRHCPICQKKSKIKIEISSKVKGENLSYEKLIPYWNGFFKEKIFFSYARCQTCKLLFCPTFFHLEQLEKLYEQMPPNMDLVPEAALRRLRLVILKYCGSIRI